MRENEFSRVYRGDVLRRAPQSLRLAAKSDECAALAQRFGVERLESLTADLRLCPDEKGQTLSVNGRLCADLVQTCIVSGDSFTQAMDEDFQLIFSFVPLCRDDLSDIEEADPEGIDLGEAVVQQFAVFLDPYPRRDGAQWQGVSIDVAPPENKEQAPPTKRPFDQLRVLKGG